MQDGSVSDASREVQYLDMVLQESLRIYPPGARCSDVYVRGELIERDTVHVHVRGRGLQ